MIRRFPAGTRARRFGAVHPHNPHVALLDKWFVESPDGLYLHRDGSWYTAAHSGDFEGYFDSEAQALAVLHNNPNPYPG